jgi:trigger factor
MTANIESISALERRMNMSLPLAQVDKEVGERLRRLARTVRMPGFRPGKVPLKLVAQQYEPQVRGEVISDAVQKAFSEAVQGQNLRVAGYPKFENGENSGSEALQIIATFEVYPEVNLGDTSTLSIQKPTFTVGDAEVERTIQSIRRQRAEFVAAERPVQSGDRVTLDFQGSIDGTVFQGGSGTDAPFVLGEGRLLPDFETGVMGASAGEARSFDARFPENYGNADLAGKTARFEVTVKRIEEPKLPELDAEFAKALGVEDGDLARMREEIGENVRREVAQRLAARTKQAVMNALLESTTLEVPRALVEAEMGRMVENMRADLQARGMNVEKMPLDPEFFREQATRRVRLGLIIAEYIKRYSLTAKPEQVRKLVEDSARTFEQPFEVIKWVYSQPERLAEFEGMAVEENVVTWVIEHAKTEELALAFDELMGAGTSA